MIEQKVGDPMPAPDRIVLGRELFPENSLWRQFFSEGADPYTLTGRRRPADIFTQPVNQAIRIKLKPLSELQNRGINTIGELLAADPESLGTRLVDATGVSLARYMNNLAVTQEARFVRTLFGWHGIREVDLPYPSAVTPDKEDELVEAVQRALGAISPDEADFIDGKWGFSRGFGATTSQMTKDTGLHYNTITSRQIRACEKLLKTSGEILRRFIQYPADSVANVHLSRYGNDLPYGIEDVELDEDAWFFGVLERARVIYLSSYSGEDPKYKINPVSFFAAPATTISDAYVNVVLEHLEEAQLDAVWAQNEQERQLEAKLANLHESTDLEMNVLRQLAQTSVNDLGLTPRSRNCLRRAGIRTITDLIKQIDTLLHIRNFGEQSYRETIFALDEYISNLNKD
ncbi:hypothetical protein A2690_04425 [Candidatus Roizmanbacteria bacterium RIFCSPHIGHO2_01_FULL_39_12b]|uniref:RNA polymerase alpha subunit C-terminal domain-containing protein n=1 Tax=Candidatus Roizmanbacteria bacterium RIFCSPHIGHO2_01_FULL_39_12b TaxID=1802030 RepID=A0A1F7GB89_9BACT|nr:MAG: hypothetical protein A2690_04425 [Candidatus Roizmanbacteria bacterium RIFCSPHIGHO2_01_FULL_39_12b]